MKLELNASALNKDDQSGIDHFSIILTSEDVKTLISHINRVASRKGHVKAAKYPWNNISAWKDKTGVSQIDISRMSSMVVVAPDFLYFMVLDRNSTTTFTTDGLGSEHLDFLAKCEDETIDMR